MALENLRWSNLTLCNTSIGKAGYNIDTNQTAAQNILEYAKPGTAGRVAYCTGANQSDQTARLLSFSGWLYFTDRDDYESLINAVEAKRINPRYMIGTLVYGLGGDSSISETEMLCINFDTSNHRQNAAGQFICNFTASFGKWGE